MKIHRRTLLSIKCFIPMNKLLASFSKKSYLLYIVRFLVLYQATVLVVIRMHRSLLPTASHMKKVSNSLQCLGSKLSRPLLGFSKDNCSDNCWQYGTILLKYVVKFVPFCHCQVVEFFLLRPPTKTLMSKSACEKVDFSRNL